MKPFEPKGDVAQWRVVYDMLVKLEIGDLLRYEDLLEALDMKARERVRGPVRKAAAVWGEEFHRALVPVYGIGYRVAEPTEHELIARKHHRKSRRALGRSRAAIRDVDRSLLTPAERARFDRMEVELSRHSDMIKRIDLKQEKIQKTIEADRAARQATDDKVARLEEALRRRGIVDMD